MKTNGIPTSKECKRQREKLNLSQGDLARLCGVNQSTISRFELDTQTINYIDYFRIISQLGYDFTFKKREATNEQN